MTPTLITRRASPQPTVSALVVQPHLSHLLQILSSLTALGFDALVAETFQDAKSALADRPALLLTDVRLHDYNGLHLVLRGKAIWKDLPSIVTADGDDSVLRQEAEQLGATFVALPATTTELMAAIVRTLRRSPADTVTAIRPPFERRLAERRVASRVATAPQERRLVERRRDLRPLIVQPR